MKKNNLKYNILYYISFVLTILCAYVSSSLVLIFDKGIFSIINLLLLSINIVLVFIYSYMLFKKRKLKVDSINFPILYLVFSFIVIFIAIIYNDKLIVPYIQFNYYTSFILWNYTMLNTYSLLQFNKKTKKKKSFKK